MRLVGISPVLAPDKERETGKAVLCTLDAVLGKDWKGNTSPLYADFPDPSTSVRCHQLWPDFVLWNYVEVSYDVH